MSASITHADMELAKAILGDLPYVASRTSQLAYHLADMRAVERERCAQLCEKRCRNRVTGAVLAGLIRGGNEP